MTLIFQPTVNSYRRFAPGTFAPPGLTWGYENRTTCFRIVGHDAGCLRVENRLPGADTNPYLTAAATIAAGVAGILEKIEPEAETIGSGYAQTPSRDFARSMPEAIERLRGSAFAKDWLGERFVEAFTATRQCQYDEFLQEGAGCRTGPLLRSGMTAMDPNLRNLFLEGMSRAATFVAVATTDGEAGRYGVTISSLTSVSADGDHPSLLACIHHLSPAATAILKNRAFCANLLGEGQQDLANLFAGRRSARMRHPASTVWLGTPGQAGQPMLDGATAAFECRLATALLWETHYIIVGKVTSVLLSDDPCRAAVRAARLSSGGAS